MFLKSSEGMNTDKDGVNKRGLEVFLQNIQLY